MVGKKYMEDPNLKWMMKIGGTMGYPYGSGSHHFLHQKHGRGRARSPLQLKARWDETDEPDGTWAPPDVGDMAMTAMINRCKTHMTMR